jgi:HPt (histidine-containing phosphotransfer) domain-containing protein
VDRAIAELAKALKETLENLGVCFNQVLDVVLQQEKRLQRLEGLFPQDLRTQLLDLQHSIEGLQDADRRSRALGALTVLCNLLGVEDLEG